MVTSEWPVPGLQHSGLFIQRQVEYLRAAGIEVQVFHFRGKKNPLRYLRAWFDFRRELKRNAYDLVHGQFGQAGLLALPKRLPLVMTFRGTDLSGVIINSRGKRLWHGRLLGVVSRFMARVADVVIVVADRMKPYVAPEKQIAVIPSGIDLDLFRPLPQAESRDRIGVPHDRHLVLFAGNPAMALKRFGLAQQAVALAGQSLPVQLVHAWGVDHASMPYYLNACDVLVLTSIDEGSPNIVKEALACNLPVVSVDVGDIRERIAGIDGCEVCADDSPETIGAALNRVLERGQRVQGRESVSHLDERTLARKVIEIYKRAISRSRCEVPSTTAE